MNKLDTLMRNLDAEVAAGDATERFLRLAAQHLRIDRIRRPDGTDWDDVIVGWDALRAALRGGSHQPEDDTILDSPNSLQGRIAELRARDFKRINDPRGASPQEPGKP